MQPKWNSRERRFLSSEIPKFQSSVGSLFDDRLRALIQQFSGLLDSPGEAAVFRKFLTVARELSEWLEAVGICQILDGAADGWAKMHDAMDFHEWWSLVAEEAYQRDTRPSRVRFHVFVETFSMVLLAVHLGHESAANAFLKAIASQDQDDSCDNWRLSTGALAFQLRLYERWTGKAAGLNWAKLPPLGRYENLFSSACIGAQFREDLAWVCEEHILQTRSTERYYPPFKTGTFRIMPIEIIMWLRWRRREGLEVATDGHPLLESPLAVLDIPAVSETVSEHRALLERAIPQLRAFLSQP